MLTPDARRRLHLCDLLRRAQRERDLDEATRLAGQYNRIRAHVSSTTLPAVISVVATRSGVAHIRAEA